MLKLAIGKAARRLPGEESREADTSADKSANSDYEQIGRFNEENSCSKLSPDTDKTSIR